MEDYAHELVDEFITFLGTEPAEGDLTDFLDEWIKEGNAIELVGGNYTLFLRVALFIVHRLMTDPNSFGVHAAGITFRELNVATETPMCMDPGYWDHFVFVRKYGQVSPRQRQSSGEE